MGHIREQIEASAAARGLRYYYGSWARLNKDLDIFANLADTEAAVLHIEHTQGSVSFTDGDYYTVTARTEQVNVGVGRKIPFDYDSTAVNAIVDGLIGHGTGIVQDINAAGMRVENATYQVLYDKFDANLVVVMFSFTYREDPEC